jgi:site-specific recombinase XerD
MPRMPLIRRKMLEWLDEKEGELLSRGTLDLYETHVTALIRFLEDRDYPLHPRKLTGKHIREFYESLSDLALGTQANRMTVIRLFLMWAGNEAIRNMKIRITPVRTRVDWLTEGELERDRCFLSRLWEVLPLH